MDFLNDGQSGDKTSVVLPGGGDSSFGSVLHRGDFMSGNKAGVKAVTNLDAVSSIEIPASWGRFDEKSLIGHSVVFCPGNDQGTQISLLDRARPLDKQSAEAFKNLVSAKLPTPRVVYADNPKPDAQSVALFKSLASVLGANQVGDNQLTSGPAGPDSRRPAFHLDRARVMEVNGKNVLAVDGWFTQMDDRAQIKMGPDGPVKRYFSGIFFDPDDKGAKVDEMYLMSDDQSSFVGAKSAFNAATKSINWL